MARTHNGEASGVADTRKAVSMADVARVAGVSQQTVSRVVNDMPNVSDKTRERVKAAMDELGFRPSYAGRSLRGGRYRSVGLCVNDVTEVGNLTMLDGVAAAAREHRVCRDAHGGEQGGELVACRGCALDVRSSG